MFYSRVQENLSRHSARNGIMTILLASFAANSSQEVPFLSGKESHIVNLAMRNSKIEVKETVTLNAKKRKRLQISVPGVGILSLTTRLSTTVKTVGSNQV